MMLRAVAVLVLLTARAVAADGLAGLEPGPRATVVAVTDGDTVTLDDGRELRLALILAPRLSLGRGWIADQPLAHRARAALARLVLNKTVMLHYGAIRRDRHGRLLAQLTLDDGSWVQGRLLEAGLARVYPLAGDGGPAAAMLRLEEAARRARRGIWALSYFAVHDAARPRDVPIDSFQLVEGMVVATANVDGRVYVNFGEDWTTDVTASVAPEDRDRFRDAGLDPLSLEGHVIRVRGWTGWRNGPMIPLVDPDQIEVLDETWPDHVTP